MQERCVDIPTQEKQHGIRGCLEMYPEAHHGFAFPHRHVFHEASAERRWERLFELFARNL